MMITTSRYGELDPERVNIVYNGLVNQNVNM